MTKIINGRVPVMMFNQTRLVPHVTYTNCKRDEPARPYWHEVLWCERGEDWYGLEFYAGKKQTVLVVTREDWLQSKEYKP